MDRKVLVKIFHAAKLRAGNHMSGEDNPHLEGGWPWRCASETGYEARLVKREITGAKGAFPRWPCKRVLAGREAPGALCLQAGGRRQDLQMSGHAAARKVQPETVDEDIEE